MDFKENSNLQDYLRKKEIQKETVKANRKRIIEQQNKDSWKRYQTYLQDRLSGNTLFIGSNGPNVPVLDDLLLYYDAGVLSSYSGSGTLFGDLSGNSRSGTIVGSPTWNPNGWFDFSNDYIITPDLDQAITAAAEDHSVEVWVYPTNNGVIVNYNSDTDPTTGYRFSAIELVSGQVEFGLWNGTGISSTNGTGALTLNAWHQIAMTYDKTTARGYIDGQLVGSVNVTFNSMMDDGQPKFLMMFGVECITNQGNGTYFDGRFAIAKVYGRALSSTEILQNYTALNRRFI